MSNTPHKDALTAEQINQKAIDFADGRERRGCAYWYGLRDGYKAAMEEYASLQQSKGHDLEPGVQSPDSASVASHSCTDGNSIEQLLDEAIDRVKNHENTYSVYPTKNTDKSYWQGRHHEAQFWRNKFNEMLNSEQEDKRSVATEGDSSTGDDNLK
jgi:hypothetical protein